MPIAALEDRKSLSAAWLQAVSFLKARPGRKSYNLAYVVSEPHLKTVEDVQVISAVDAFAKGAGEHPVTTVANTIFPLACYRRGGPSGVFEGYLRDVYPRVKRGWGNYIERMLRRRDITGKLLCDREGKPINPLQSLTQKLKKRVDTGGSTTHYELPVSDEVFELSTYDPARDAKYHRGGPCLSHLSFKLDPACSLRLTAFYRSHFYLERALGNLVGLARLQQFVATEAGCNVGSLTLIASEACLESSLGTAKAADVHAFLAGLGV